MYASISVIEIYIYTAIIRFVHDLCELLQQGHSKRSGQSGFSQTTFCRGDIYFLKFEVGQFAHTNDI